MSAVQTDAPSGSDKTVVHRHTNLATISTGACNFPVEIMGKIFQELRNRVEYTDMSPSSFPNRDDTWFTVGPPTTITRVNRAWRNIALSMPSLWTSFPVLLENDNCLNIGNPGQLEYHLRHSGDLPLSVAIGGPAQLSGSGIVAESPTTTATLDFLEKLAPRVRSLALAIENGSDIHRELLKTEHAFIHLENVTLHGMAPVPSLNGTGIWKSPLLQRVVWSMPTGSNTPILSPTWFGLTELVLSDSYEATIPPGHLRHFLSLGTKLTRLQCRVGHVKSGGNDYGDIPLAYDFRYPPYPKLHHLTLEVLSLTLEGAQECDLDAIPHILSDFHTPKLRSMSYRLTTSATCDPASGMFWLRMGSPSNLTYFECLVPEIDPQVLLQGVKSMPKLEVFRWLGVIKTVGSDSSIRLVDDRFLRNFAPPRAFDVQAALLQDTIATPLTIKDIPCPHLRELHIGYADLTNGGIKAFIESRLYGTGSISVDATATGFQCFKIGVLARHDLGQVYETRRLRKHLSAEHSVYLTVDRYVDDQWASLCGQPGHNAKAWYAVGRLEI